MSPLLTREDGAGGQAAWQHGMALLPALAGTAILRGGSSIYI